MAERSYNPVTAMDEAQATGEAAAVFADIRQTMGIPLVTSIWRGLADMDDSLPRAWSIAKPLYQSGQPEAGLARVVADTGLPIPALVTASQLACVGVDRDGIRQAKAVIAAYNRSNGMNLIALTALITPAQPIEGQPTPLLEATTPTYPAWPNFPALAAQADIDPVVWEMVCQVNVMGARSPNAFVATLWRHLAHWPGLLALTLAAFQPLQSAGAIRDAAARMVDLAAFEGTRMSGLHSGIEGLSAEARETITEYVVKPAHVARMVTIGHALAAWLDTVED